MAPFDRRDLEVLLAPHAPPCVSVLLPTPRRVTSGDQHAVRLRSLLRQVEERLPEAPERGELLEPIAALARSDTWASSAEGLALFRSPSFFAHHRLPVPLAERVVVADSFHVRPLLLFSRITSATTCWPSA